MLRNLFVLAIVLVGLRYALEGPFSLLLFYIWNAYFRPEEWVWFDLVRRLRLSLLIGLALILVAPFSQDRFRLDWRSSLLFIFLLHTLLTTLASPYFDYAWSYWQDFAKSTLITYFIASMVTDTARLRLLLAVMSLSLGFEAAKQGWAQFVLNPGAQNFNTVAFLGDNNGVAVGVAMLIPVMSALAQTSRTQTERWMWRFFLAGVVYRTVSTYSRGGFLSLLTLVLLWLSRSPHKLRTLVATAFVAGAIVPVMPQPFWDRMETILAPPEQRDESATGRLHFWRVAMAMANARPLTGVGHNAYNLAYDEYDFSLGLYARARSVHSSWFGMLAEHGYVGLAMFVGLVAGALFGCGRMRRRTRKDPAAKDLYLYATAVQTSLVVFCVGGSFVIFHYTEMLWHLVGVSMALATMAARVVPAAVSDQALSTEARLSYRVPVQVSARSG